MKIAMIGHKRIPSREGGVEIVVEELSTRLVQMGHYVTAYNRKGRHVSDKNVDLDKQKLKEYKGVKIVRVPTPKNKALNAIVYSFLATIMAVFKRHDVIHFHAEGPCIVLPLAHLMRIRTVATIHGLDWQRAKWGGFATKMLKYGEKMAAKYADEVIVLSRNVQQYFLQTYKRQTVYIPNGVERAELIRPDIISNEFGLTENKYILYLGRIVPEKGITYLLDAFLKVNSDMKLVIAGGSSHSDSYFDEIRALAERDPRVILTGFVQGKLLAELYSNAYLYVLPSDVEGMPISLLEALSFGRKCLVSDIPENIEVCGEYALSFRKSDIDDLAGKLQKAIDSPDLFRSEADIMDYCYNRFNWDRVTDSTVRLYTCKRNTTED